MGSSHHGGDTKFMDAFREKDQDLLRKMFNEQLTGKAQPKFPEGKIQEDDEGALALRVAADKENQVLRIEFGKQVTWLGLPKAEAIGFAELILAFAEDLD